jgi:hypothetical protein
MKTTVPTEKQAAIFELQHAGEFTDIENSAIVYVLRGWFAGLGGVPGAIQAGMTHGHSQRCSSILLA